MNAATVLVVDDTPAGLGVVCDTLRRHGIRVLLAESARAAREVLAHASPDLVLLDVVMPDEDGFQLCTTLRDDPRWRSLPIIFLTAIDQPDQKVRAFALGAVDYVTKPVHVPELIARVRAQLDLVAARRALEAQNAELESQVALRLDAEAQLASSLDRAVLVLARDGSLLFSTRLAHDLMSKFGATPSALAKTARFVAGDGALLVRRFTESGRDDLLMIALEEEHAPPGPAALLAVGLTPRQAEVAYWVAQGKSNPEVGIIIGASARTIDKHMEGILARLNLENRAALMLAAADWLRPKR